MNYITTGLTYYFYKKIKFFKSINYNIIIIYNYPKTIRNIL